MRIANVIIKYLYDNGIRHAYGIPTAQISGFCDALNDYDIEYVVVKNEAAATYAAGRYADLTRELGVCIVGGCVGIGNAINGIGDAYRNKLPMLIISSVVARANMGKNSLQELTTTDITQPITKYSKTVYDEKDVLVEIKKAMEIALTPPQGPVHISIPIDIQLLDYDGQNPEIINTNEILPKFDDTKLTEAIDAINSCNTGVIMVGRGARGLEKEIKELSLKTKWPIITTPNGKGIIDSEFELNLGNYGWCTNKSAEYFIDNTELDCVLILGSSLGQMSTRVYNRSLIKNRKVIHIDWDKTEFNKIFKCDIPVFYDLRQAIPKILQKVNEKKQILEIPNVADIYVKNHTGLSLRLVVEKLVDIVPDNTCFVQDMGENMNFSLKYMNLKQGMDYQISLHYASMGTAIAGVVGSYCANKDKTYAVIAGDGSFFMNGTEIMTAKEHNMPIIYFIVNNSMLGLVEHGGKFVYGRSHKGHCVFQHVSISEIAKNMGIESVRIEKLDELEEIKSILINRDSPIVIELVTDGSEQLMDTARWKK